MVAARKLRSSNSPAGLSSALYPLPEAQTSRAPLARTYMRSLPISAGSKSADRRRDAAMAQQPVELQRKMQQLLKESPELRQQQEKMRAKEEHLRGHCGHCGEASQELKRCSRCLGIKYCSVTCQIAGWPGHMQDCKTMKQMRRARETIMGDPELIRSMVHMVDEGRVAPGRKITLQHMTGNMAKYEGFDAHVACPHAHPEDVTAEQVAELDQQGLLPVVVSYVKVSATLVAAVGAVQLNLDIGTVKVGLGIYHDQLAVHVGNPPRYYARSQELLQPLLKGDVDELRSYLDSGGDVDAVLRFETPGISESNPPGDESLEGDALPLLGHLILMSLQEQVQLLLQRGATIFVGAVGFAVRTMCMTPRDESSQVLELLLSSATIAMINSCDEEKGAMSALHIAAIHGRKDLAARLIRAGASSSLQDGKGRTWVQLLQNTCRLHAAILSGRGPEVETLITDDLHAVNLPLNLNEPSEFNVPPLHLGIMYGHLTVVQALLKCGADVMAVDRKGVGYTPLMCAVSMHIFTPDARRIVETLIEHGAKVNFTLSNQNVADRTALMLLVDNAVKEDVPEAVFSMQVALIKTLLDAGADTALLDRNSCNVLHIAQQLGCESSSMHEYRKRDIILKMIRTSTEQERLSIVKEVTRLTMRGKGRIIVDPTGRQLSHSN